MPRHRLEMAMGEATNRLIDEITDLLRQATLNDLMELGHGEPEPAVQVEMPVAEVPARQPVAEPLVKDETPAPATLIKPIKTRTWPTCSAPGCTGKMYGPSGKARLCYQHHLEGGGKPSPFSRKRSKADEADEGPQPAVEARQGGKNDPDGPGEQERTPAAVEGPGTGPVAVDSPPVTQEQESAPSAAEAPVADLAGTSSKTSAPRRSIKDLRRSAVDPSVFVRGKGANGRSKGTEPAARGLDQAEALFDMPGRRRDK